MANPNELGNTATGSDRPYGVEIEANDILVDGCTVRGFQNGIAQRATGEWYRAQIIGNQVIECLGAGRGKSTVDSRGEDRGDGITIWGAGSVVLGNTVTLKAGQDGRVGIHGERLAAFAAEDGLYPHSTVTFMGNLVEGNWRRMGVLEGMTNAVMIGNIASGEAGGWAFAIVEGCRLCTMENNTTYWLGTHTSWPNWSPTIACLKIYDDGWENTMRGNAVYMAPGTATAIGMSLQMVNGINEDTLFEDNKIIAEDGTVTFTTAQARIQETGGFKAVRPVMRRNIFKGTAPHGAIIEDCEDAVLDRNRFLSYNTGSKSGTYGIYLNDADIENATLIGNICQNWGNGIRLPSITGGAARDNLIEDCDTGIFGGASISKFWVTGNRFRNIAGNRVDTFNRASRPWIKDNEGQTFFAETNYNPPSLAAGGDASTTITVTGAAMGDDVEVIRNASQNGVNIFGYVSAADTVTIVHDNQTGGTQDLVAADYFVTVRKYGAYA